MLPAFATLPLLLHLPQTSFTDAYFETMSAIDHHRRDRDDRSRRAAAAWACSFAMLIGRLELMSVLVLMTPDFWRR